MSDVTKCPTSAEFLVLVLITLYTQKNFLNIHGLAMLIYLDGDEGQVRFLQVL